MMLLQLAMKTAMATCRIVQSQTKAFCEYRCPCSADILRDAALMSSPAYDCLRQSTRPSPAAYTSCKPRTRSLANSDLKAGKFEVLFTCGIAATAWRRPNAFGQATEGAAITVNTDCRGHMLRRAKQARTFLRSQAPSWLTPFLEMRRCGPQTDDCLRQSKRPSHAAPTACKPRTRSP